ncbi:MAG: Ig-like domain-containing protein [Thermoleophilaceae bacterium]
MVVYGVVKPLHAGARVKQAGSKNVLMTVGRGGAYLYYEDAAPSRPYPHRGRVALVGASSGGTTVSGALSRRPLVNGARPALQRVFASDPFAPIETFLNPGEGNNPPKADKQSVVVKRDRPRTITVTGSDGDGDDFGFFVTKSPSHGTLSGALPEVVYTPNPGYLGTDSFSFRTLDNKDAQSNTARVSINVVPLGSPPAVTASGGCTAYTEGAPAVTVDPALTVTDPDDADLASAAVRVANLEGGDDLRFTDQSGISGSYDDDTGVLHLNGTASVATYQAALRTVKYRNLSNGSPSATKDIEFTANDAGSDSAPATKHVCITDTGAGDKPVSGTSEGALNYTENDGPVPIDSELFITDADSANLSGATVKFAASLDPNDDEVFGTGPGGSTNTYVPTEDVLAFADQNGITGSWDGVNGVLTLSGSSSVANYQAAIRSVAYENTSENPSAAPRAIRFQLTDSDGNNSAANSRGILVTPVNDAPVATPSDGATAYTEGDPATTVDSALTVGDVDDTQLEGGQVRISGGFEAGDELVYADQLGIAGNYDTGTGVLTLTGTASVADYETALRSIQFRGTSDDPPASKSVEFVVGDGDLDSAAAAKGIAVTPVNDKPVLDASDTALAYSEGDGQVAVDDAIAVSDVDSPTLAGATVQVTGNYDAGQDQLVFSDQGGISGAWDGDSGTLTLSGSASLADYQAALRSVAYENSSDAPSSATRTVSFQVDDGAGSDNLSDAVTRDVGVTPVNDAPVVTASGDPTSYSPGDTTGVVVDDALSLTDVDDSDLESAQVRIASGFDPGDELLFTDQSGISGAYDSDTGVLTLTGTASVLDYATALRSVAFRTTAESPAASKRVEYTANDGDAGSEATSKSIDVVQPSTDVAPVVTTSGGSTAYGSGDPAVPVDSAVTVTDEDDANLESARVRITGGLDPTDVLSFTDTDAITGSFDPENGVLNLNGTAPVADYQAALRAVKFGTNSASPSSRTIEFTVNDGDSDSNAGLQTLDVGAPTF